MPFDYFLKIPNVIGGSDQVAHLGWIEVISGSWGHGKPLDPLTDAPTGKPLPQLFRITKPVDSASPNIGALLVARTPIDVVEFHAYRGDLLVPGNVMEIRLIKAVVESQFQSGASGTSLTEVVAFSYTRLECKYFQVQSDGRLAFLNSYAYTPSI